MRVALVAFAALTLASSVGASTPPALRIVRLTPSVAVRGTHFHARERVRVRLAAGAVHVSRSVRTSSTGAFTAAFDTARGLDPCTDAVSVVAVGAAGDRATVKYVARACPPAP